MSDFGNDFEIAIGAVFDKASEQRAIAEFLQFQGRVDQAATAGTRKQTRDAQQAQTQRLRDQQAANRKWTDAEKQQARALTLVMREFFRERAQAEREASQSQRREFERRAKEQLAEQRAANQRLQAVVAAGLKDAAARRKSAQKIREQDNASGLRRFENQEKEAARNLERLAKEQFRESERLAKEAGRNLERYAKEQARERERVAKESAATAARLDKERIAQSAAAAKEEAALARREGERLAQQQKQADRLLFNAEQESSAKRIARAKALYSTLATVARTGSQAGLNVVTSFFRRRENAAKRNGDRITNIDRSTSNDQTLVIRQQLEVQNSIYSRAAAKRLETIERTSAKERRVITENAVRTAKATEAIRSRTNTGVVGAVAGRSSAGQVLRGALAVTGGTLVLRQIAAEATEAAKTQAQTEAVIKSTGRAANVSGRYVADYAQRLSQLAAVDDEAVQAAENLLLTFTNIKNVGKDRIFDRATASVLDMSVALKQDLKSSSIQLGKALNDPIKGITALSRVGVSFTAKQKERIKSFVAEGRVVEAQKVILAELSREFGGSAAAAASAGDRFKVFVANIEESIGLRLKPLVDGLLDGFVNLATNIMSGKGAWKILRDGLIGVAIGLGAVLAVKAGVETVGLLGQGLALLAANPGILAIAALGAAAAILYRNSAGVRSFFGALVEGTKNWYLVGYRIAEPIKNLSKLVLIQSSFGAAVRAIVDGFSAMRRGVDEFRDGLGTQGFTDALGATLGNIGDALAPAKDAVADGLKVIFERGRDFLTQRALPILGEARLNVGSFLLPLLGLSGGDGGVVSRVVTSAITKLFLGSISSFNPDIPAAQLGTRTREIIDGAIAYAQGSARNVKTFFASLFGGDIEVGNFSSELGGQLNEIISGAFGRLKERVGPVKDLMASIGSAIAAGFTTYVLPKLIELPRIVGRFLSRTVFSEEFLKAVTITAAAVAGVAIVVAGQFVRGFVEGLISRRGDIAKTVIDILSFVAKTVIGSGNPLVFIGGALVAAFAGAKVLGAIGTLRGQFRIAAAGMTGDAAKLQQAVADAAQAKQPASTSKVGNAALAISDGYRKAETVVRRIGGTIENAGAKTIKLGGLIDGVGNRLLKLPLDATTNAAGRLVSGTTGRFVKDTTASLNSLQRRAGEFANKYAGLLSTPLVKAGAALQSFPRTVQSKLQAASSDVKNFASTLSSTVPDGVSKAQLAVQVGASAMTGYLSGLAETSQAKAVGILASVGEVAAAFADGGPVVGGITAVATAIGLVWGNSSAAAERAQERQKVIAANLTASAEEIGAAFRAAFKDQGGATSGEGRAAGVLRIIRDLLDVSSKGAKDFADRFKTDMNDVATAASLPRKEFERFTSAVIDRNVSEVLEGNADAIKRFSNQTRIAGQAAVTSFLDSIASKEDSATFERILQSSGADIIDLQKKVQTGAISIGEFRDRMVEIGFTTQDADRAYKAYKESLTEAIGNTAGGQFLRNLPGQLYASVRQQAILNEANAELQSRLEGFGPVAERFSSAWGRIKAAIDKAKEAYLNWVDASTGRKLSRAEAISGLFGAAQDFTTPEEGENSLLAEARQTRARVEAQRVIAGQLQELAKRAAGDPAKLNALINDFFNELRAGTNDKETIDFFNQIQYLTADPQSIQILVDSQPAIEGLNGLETQIRTLLQLPENSPLRVGLEKARNFDESKMLVTASLTELAKQDPRIQAYIEKNGGFDTVVASIAADAGFIDSLKAKAEADLDADPFTKKKNLITAGLAELEKRETTLRVTPKLYDPTGGWTKLFGFLGIDLSLGSGKNSIGAAPPGFNNAERQNRWGGVTAYATGGITQAHVQRHQRIKYAEPQTGGEAYIPRLGNRRRSMAVLQKAASWLGGRFVPGTLPMAAGGVVVSTGESLYANGLTSPAEAAAERRLSAHITEVLARIDRIMARISKSMSLAEARAAVIEATAAHHQLGAAEGAQWDAALTRFFAGATVPMASVGPTLPTPTRPASSPTANIDFTKPTVVINRNLTVQNDITATQPIPTALEVVRKARDSDFLAGGRSIEMEFIA